MTKTKKMNAYKEYRQMYSCNLDGNAAIHTLADKFNEWLAKAKPNDRYIYHVGLGLYDTVLSGQCKKVVWEQACLGNVFLFQRRKGPYIFEYIAVKSNRMPNSKMVPDYEGTTKSGAQSMYRSAPRRSSLIERVA